jgi:serine/threonine protein kinase
LEYIHIHGIVHRDIKPENVVVSQKFVAKICDFSCALQNGQTPGESMPIGTPAYMAPDVLHNYVSRLIFSYIALILIL